MKNETIKRKEIQKKLYFSPDVSKVILTKLKIVINFI